MQDFIEKWSVKPLTQLKTEQKRIKKYLYDPMVYWNALQQYKKKYVILTKLIKSKEIEIEKLKLQEPPRKSRQYVAP